MAFYKITYNRKYDFATVHNYGCTFKCPICSYKLRSGAEGKPGLAYPAPSVFLTTAEIKKTLTEVSPKQIRFMGGEPTVAKTLPDILEFAKKELGAETILGHTNGSNLEFENLDAANVGLKAWNTGTHLSLTGIEKEKIYGQFEKAADRGMKLSANLIYIPGLVDLDQIDAVAKYISEYGNIPFHIMGYIPVPGQPYRRPTLDEMLKAQEVAQKHIQVVKFSHLSPEEALSLERNDDRFDVEIIGGSYGAGLCKSSEIDNRFLNGGITQSGSPDSC